MTAVCSREILAAYIAGSMKYFGLLNEESNSSVIIMIMIMIIKLFVIGLGAGESIP